MKDVYLGSELLTHVPHPNPLSRTPNKLLGFILHLFILAFRLSFKILGLSSMLIYSKFLMVVAVSSCMAELPRDVYPTMQCNRRAGSGSLCARTGVANTYTSGVALTLPDSLVTQKNLMAIIYYVIINPKLTTSKVLVVVCKPYRLFRIGDKTLTYMKMYVHTCADSN